jgi:GT2 family glycosyltransferase
MKEVNICTMVYNRHDLLRGLLISLRNSTVKPTAVYVVDHSYDLLLVNRFTENILPCPINIVTLDDPGVAHGSNWLLRNVPEERIGCGDDIEFMPDTIERMLETPGDFVITDTTAQLGLNPGACCLIRNSCVEKIGYFDEKLSPHYLYYEDTDYLRRLALAGLPQTVAVGAYVNHVNGGSQSYLSLTPAQLEEHHRKFEIATQNYIKKWGGLPFKEILTTPNEL